MEDSKGIRHSHQLVSRALEVKKPYKDTLRMFRTLYAAKQEEFEDDLEENFNKDSI